MIHRNVPSIYAVNGIVLAIGGSTLVIYSDEREGETSPSDMNAKLKGVRYDRHEPTNRTEGGAGRRGPGRCPTVVMGASPAVAAPVRGPETVGVGDTSITLEFDNKLRSRVALKNVGVTLFDASEVLLLGDTAVDEFTYRGHETRRTRHSRHGEGVQVTVRGDSTTGVRKTVELTSFQRLTGMIVMKVTYTNTSGGKLKVTGWRSGAHELLGGPAGFYTFSGTTHTDRRDWVQPMTKTYHQENSLGMDSSDYGGGTPMASVWRPGAGLSVGHVEPVAKILSLPVRRTAAGASIAVEEQPPRHPRSRARS